MLFAVTMEVDFPGDLDAQSRAALIAEEKEYCRRLQSSGVWLHLWRAVGKYANLSVFDVESNDALHDILWRLPLFPYMTITVTPLALHPSDIAATTAGDGE